MGDAVLADAAGGGRFIAGSTLDEAVGNARRLNGEGIRLTMDHLGEAVTSEAEAEAAAQEYHVLLGRIAKEKLDSTVSIKLTQVGLALDAGKCRERVRALVERSVQVGSSVEIDMEDTPYTDVTLDIYREMLKVDPKLRVCLQAYLFRSMEDLKGLIELRGSVRLVKGAYKEPPSVAFPAKRDVDANFDRMTECGMSKAAVGRGFYLAAATHDDRRVERALAVEKENGLSRSQFEFQFLYGIRTELQRRLARDGCTVRVYLPYGEQWYPYFMRRLAERPANVLFLLKNLFKS